MSDNSAQSGLSFWKKLSFSQKLSIVFIGSFVIATPLAVVASLQQTRTTSQAALKVDQTIALPTRTPTQTAGIKLPEGITLQQALTTKGKFMPQDRKVAIVGAETLYNENLNYLVYKRYYPEYVSPTMNSADLTNKILTEAINDSILIQSANNDRQTFGQIDISQNIFNHLNINYNLREKLLTDLKSSFNSKLEEKLSGEKISIWYHNVDPPKKYTLEQARNIAQEKITALYNKLTDPVNKITFSQAFDLIKNDTSLADLDPSYIINGYTQFTNKSPEEIAFGSAKVKAAVMKLSPGEISDIFEQRNPIPQPKGEEFFSIWTITSRTNSGQGDLDTWINKQKNNLSINILP